MAPIRRPFQGVWNIIRFNWHFYLLSLGLVTILLFLNNFIESPYHLYVIILCVLMLLAIANALVASFYIYDASGLYKLNWAGQPMPLSSSVGEFSAARIVNIHAGFDETSLLLKHKFPDTHLFVFDFYDPAKHTEVSIKRARRAYPPYPDTREINTGSISLESDFADRIFITLSAHEIRDRAERNAFFIECNRVLKRGGQIYVTEHLRDLPNFIAFNIGFFHFLPKASWYEAFEAAGLKVAGETRINPFITNFILEKYGTSM